MPRSTDSLLRPEAQPLGWEFLNDSQRRAFRQLASQIEGAIDDLTHRDELQKELATDRVLTWIRHDMQARLSMLEGGRGSGKTTVLLSLLDICDRDAHKQPGVPDDLRDPLDKIDKRSIWLDPIDLDMFPRSANLLAAILARIEVRIKRQLERDPQRDDPAAQRLLHNLYRKVAVAWGEYEGLAEAQNLDAYATDVKRTEQQRLELRSDFAELLNLLASGIFHGKRIEDPLFVLPIDDLDLNPTRCFSVLNVLRQISVPRLYAVMLGNFDLLGAMVHLKFLSDFRHASGNGLNDKWLTLDRLRFGHLAEQTAEAWIRKSIPPLQRIVIAELRPHEVLLFRPPGVTQEKHRFLFELLSELPIVLRAPDDFTPGHAVSQSLRQVFGRPVANFLDFCLFPGFRAPSPLQWGSTTPDGATGYHALAEALRGMNGDAVREAFARRTNESAYLAPSRIRSVPRNVADIWLRVQHVVRAEESQSADGKWRRLMQLAKDLCREEVLQDAALRPAERSALDQAMDRCLEREADLDAVPLAFSCELEPPHTIRTTDEAHETPREAPEVDETFVCRRDIIVRETSGWRLVPRSDNADGRQECRRETAAHFMIFHDLVTLANRRLRGIFPDMPYRQLWAETEWNAGPYESTHLRWPHPLLNSFWEYDIFLQGWNQTIRCVTPQAEDGNRVAESLQFAWIDLSLAVMTWESPWVSRSGEVVVSVPPGQEDWRELGARLERAVERTKEVSHYGLRFSRWLTRLALLFMPEVLGAGFASERRRQGRGVARKGSASSLLPLGPALEGFWLENAEFIQIKRMETLYKLTSEGMKQVVQKILKESKKPGAGLQNVIKRTTPTPSQLEAFIVGQAAKASKVSEGPAK
jgi:hypothetical protein